MRKHGVAENVKIFVIARGAYPGNFIKLNRPIKKFYHNSFSIEKRPKLQNAPAFLFELLRGASLLHGFLKACLQGKHLSLLVQEVRLASFFGFYQFRGSAV